MEEGRRSSRDEFIGSGFKEHKVCHIRVADGAFYKVYLSGDTVRHKIGSS